MHVPTRSMHANDGLSNAHESAYMYTVSVFQIQLLFLIISSVTNLNVNMSLHVSNSISYCYSKQNTPRHESQFSHTSRIEVYKYIFK